MIAKRAKRILSMPILLIALVVVCGGQLNAAAQERGGIRADLLAAAQAVLHQDAEGPSISLRPLPGAEHIFNVIDGGTPDVFAASSADLMGTVGYSGKPLDIAVFVDVTQEGARLIGAKLLHQSEPILTIGISEETLAAYIDGFRKLDADASLRALIGEERLPVPVSGATVSSGVIRDAILRTARRIALTVRKNNAVTQSNAGEALPNFVRFADVIATGRLTERRIGIDTVRKTLPGYDTLPSGDATFLDITAGILDEAGLITALFQRAVASRLEAERGAHETLLFVAANGLYSIKGTEWRRTGYFDRLEIVQGDKTISLPADRQTRIDHLTLQGAPAFREAVVILIPEKTGFDAMTPARLDVIVRAPDNTSARFGVDLKRYAWTAPAFAPSIGDDLSESWRLVWEQKAPGLVILTVMLTVLFAVLYISGPLVRRPRAYRAFRLAFLSITLVWLGWIASAQLSVVQVIGFLQALRTDFQWQVFLLDPLVFTLWAFLVLTVLFWGRGVYCGWLCPFGALQELVNIAARRFKIRQLEISWEVHERLWPIKYLLLIGIIGLSLQEMALAYRLAEVEPFKTAITLHFLRPWPFVLYVLAILVAGLFVERVFCRYLCPLGAALSLPTRFKIFDWLIRRPQCGRECRLCAATCTVQAIDPIGRINPNECIYCLRCQVNYHDPLTCVPLKMRAYRRQAASPASEETSP
jgi:NosR/NirI family nitrite reductase transcriptional regulator